jgi:hypothetical protein
MSENPPKKIIELVKDWAIEEGIMGKKIPPKEGLEFGFELKFPPGAPFQKTIALVCPKDKDFLVFQLGTQMSPEHVGVMKNTPPEKQVKFFSKMKKFFYTQNLLYNLDIPNLRWAIIDQVHFDALTKNVFFTTLRKIFNTSLYIDQILAETILEGGGSPNESSRTGPRSSLYM